MNKDYPPRELAGPSYRQRKPSKLPVPLTAEVLTRRSEIARVLGVKVESLNRHLQSLSDEQRKALFYKVTHEGPISLSGTGLKLLVDRSEKITLAVPTTDNLDAFEEKIERFATETPRDGFIANRDLARVEDIEPGQPRDRLSDELLAEYDELVKQPFVICEIELLSLAQGKTQQRSEIATALADLNNAFAFGIHGALHEHDELAPVCRAVIRCTGNMFRQLVEDDRWQRTISWFEPRPQFETFHTIWSKFRFASLGPISAPSADAPVICIVDSGVSSGNPFLDPVTKEGMLKSFLRKSLDSPFDEHGHGSGVASLAAYYAINLEEGAVNVARAWIASARILDASNQIEEERLFSKLLEEVVEEFVPLGVRIFNLSVADLAKRWNQDTKRTQPRTSWTARTIDRLSRANDIVFVVSTGNIPLQDLQNYLRADTPYPMYLSDDDSRILDPAQAGLALSVGSIAAGTLVASSAGTAIALSYEPSPFTRSGPGIKGETKPDLVEIGGNLIREGEPPTIRPNPGTNVVMASHQLSPAAVHNYGTSFAAPRVAYKLAVLLHELQGLGIGRVSAPLLKAFIVNSASHRGDLAPIKARLDEIDTAQLFNILGHGFPDSTRATDCDDYSILLFHQGTIEPNQVAFFDIPVPGSLANTAAQKRITVTVAHDPEVQKWGLESYFGADLKWRMFRGDVSRDEVITAMSQGDVDNEAADENGEQSESPKELRFNRGVVRRSRGTVQHDVLEWSRHRDEFSDNDYTLAIASYKKWNRNVAASPFAVVVRIEDLGGTVHVYNEVAASLDVLIEQQIRET